LYFLLAVSNNEAFLYVDLNCSFGSISTWNIWHWQNQLLLRPIRNICITIIDMRRLSRPPSRPLLPVISCTIDSALISIMVARNRNTIWAPPPQLPIQRRAALSTNSNGTQSALKGKRWGV
jgi:hypothetical protein